MTLGGGGIYNPRMLQFFQIAAGGFSIGPGGAGYVETDVSATTGTDTTKLWVIIVKTDTNDVYPGVRPHGSAIDNKAIIRGGCTLLSYTNSAGHVDFNRDTVANLYYSFIGYFK